MAEKHIHKLSRHKHKSGSIIYFCTMPDCSYKISPGLALGKRSICNRCGEPFILSAYAIRLSKPHCEECHKPKEIIQTQNLNNLVIPMNKEERELSHPVDIGIIPLAERLKKVVNSRKVDMNDEDEI